MTRYAALHAHFADPASAFRLLFAFGWFTGVCQVSRLAEQQNVNDLTDPSLPPEAFRKTPEISTTACGQSSILIADIHGYLHLVSAPDFAVTQSWVAHERGRVTQAAFAATRGVIVTIGEDDGAPYPVLKVWMLSTRKASLEPRLVISGPVQSPQPHPVSALAITPNLSHVAIGLADGTVLLYRHLDSLLPSQQSAASSAASLPKPRMLHQSTVEPVTGLGFSPMTDAETLSKSILFVVTTNRIYTYSANGKPSNSTVIDDIGAGVACSLVTPDGKLVLAREEAIYTYNQAGREASFAYEGSKSAVHLFGSYLVIVSPPFVPSASSHSATVRHYVKNRDWSAKNDIARVGLFELNHKFIGGYSRAELPDAQSRASSTAHSSAFEEGVRDVFVQWGRLWVLGHDGELTKMEEISTSAKLGILFSKSQYLLALSLAEGIPDFDPKELSEIHREYANYLYNKGDFDGAMAQFLPTIGYIEPSFIIRKFLDARRIHNLTSFLEALHAKGLAKPAHTSLLLNCFTKLRDTARLDAFLKSSTIDSADGSPPFDLDTALRVTRQAGYYEHAVYLAKRYGQAEEYLKIQVEDREDWQEAAQYIRGMGSKAAETELVRYGKLLLRHLPDETTQLLIDVCCGTLDTQPTLNGISSPSTDSQSQSQGNNYLSYLPYTSSATQKTTASAVTSLANADSSEASPPLLNGNHSHLHIQEDLPYPRTFFPHFVENQKHFVVFLETVLRNRYSGDLPEEMAEQKAAICNTLLEIYLSIARTDAEDRAQLQGKAMDLLQTKDANHYDPGQALLVCIAASFERGMLFLYEQLGMVEDIFRYHMDHSNSAQVLQVLWKFGGRYPNLYKSALRWLSDDASRISKHAEDAERILDQIDERKLMKPVQVVKLLGRNSVTSIGLLKRYLGRSLSNEREEIDSDRALIGSYRAEVATKRKEIEALLDGKNPQVFQITRCSACGGGLDLPAIHFMCKHSYHQRCLQDTAEPSDVYDCLLCAQEHGIVKEIKRGHERLIGQHDWLLEEVRESDDPFATIAQQFGKGQIPPVALVA